MAGEVGHKCHDCKNPDPTIRGAYRREFGCDGPTARMGILLPCEVCGGSGCWACGYKRGEYVRECAYRVRERASADVHFALASYAWLRREQGGGLLPFPGTWAEQPLRLVEAWEILDREIAEIRARRMEEVKRG